MKDIRQYRCTICGTECWTNTLSKLCPKCSENSAMVDKASEALHRKQRPVYSGVLKYFPRAIMEVAHCSWVGNEQHHPGTPLHWDRSKSGDELDALVRHLMHADEVDNDGVLHIIKVCWRALAYAEKLLERELEAEAEKHGKG